MRDKGVLLAELFCESSVCGASGAMLLLAAGCQQCGRGKGRAAGAVLHGAAAALRLERRRPTHRSPSYPRALPCRLSAPLPRSGQDLHTALRSRSDGGPRAYGWHGRGRRVLLECARALNYLHRSGFVHCDIKSR